MPPVARFTRQHIIDAGLALIQQEGLEGFTARALGKRLGASTKPIFALFENMEEVKIAVLQAADAKYQTFIRSEMEKGEIPYKASGMAYIRFARQEPQLFRLLFMRDRRAEAITEDRESIRPMLDIIQEKLGICEDAAYRLHLENWIFVHGIATMVVTNYLPWDEEFISRSLSDVYFGLAARYREEVHGSH